MENGEVIYLVDSTPVRLIESQEPFWRDLEPGVAGHDVLALQHFLQDEGLLASEPSGSYDADTEAAVQSWQEELGSTPTGVVQLGETVAVPESPVEVQVGEAIRVGAELSGGEESVFAPVGERRFVMVVQEAQAQQIPTEASIRVTYDDYEWDAVISSVEDGADQSTNVEYQLTAPNGGEVCLDDCHVLPAETQLTLRSQVAVVPEIEGIGVPTAAVRISSEGEPYVTTRHGDVPVEVLGSGQGVAIVEGLEGGTEVRVFDESRSTHTMPPEDNADGDEEVINEVPEPTGQSTEEGSPESGDQSDVQEEITD
ncbi:peptidoglycan-binding domain-containing protein [Nesterenkonia alba]|uniref:peptidoglycan-binding domain-containing protein n=1 Tax=Nesterenkonia alba TaxID=515814 RepID=UPI0003B40ECC|nr:peptidoglycan-binding domain-containing protein [Nesterenkonia alba]